MGKIKTPLEILEEERQEEEKKRIELQKKDFLFASQLQQTYNQENQKIKIQQKKDALLAKNLYKTTPFNEKFLQEKKDREYAEELERKFKEDSKNQQKRKKKIKQSFSYNQIQFEKPKPFVYEKPQIITKPLVGLPNYDHPVLSISEKKKKNRIRCNIPKFSVVLDTNVLLDSRVNVLADLFFNVFVELVFFPVKVIDELDSLKFKFDPSQEEYYKLDAVTHLIETSIKSKCSNIDLQAFDDYKNQEMKKKKKKGDMIILECVNKLTKKKKNCIFITKDKLCSITSRSIKGNLKIFPSLKEFYHEILTPLEKKYFPKQWY